ncbi:unnamed protein product [Rhodiola kirilowii]
MATDAAEAPAQPPSNFSQARHFYLAVDRLEFKMETLVDLLGVAGQRPSLPMVVCCSSRDELDTVCSAVANLPFISLASLYSDLVETDRSRVLEKFRQAALRWNLKPAAQLEDEAEAAESKFKSNMIVVTDACLPLLASGEAPISARMLINYALPTKKFHDACLKETYMRRMTTCLAADGIVINMVVGGEVVTLNNIEESTSLLIAEMPINISEIL